MVRPCHHDLQLMLNSKRLTPAFFAQETLWVARQLLGKTLVRRFDSGTIVRSIIVEVEAYLATGDEASHSFGGCKNMNSAMFEDAGILYVYPIHSRHCLNVVTEASGTGAAVLIRAVEPVNGLPELGRLRNFNASQLDELQRRKRSTAVNLTRGPGRTCEALGVDRQLNRADLVCDPRIWLEPADSLVQNREWSVRCGPRIGISRSVEEPYRFFIDGNHFVSGCVRDHSCGRSMTFGEFASA